MLHSLSDQQKVFLRNNRGKTDIEVLLYYGGGEDSNI